MAYPWYEWLPAACSTLEQGDLIEACPILKPPQALAPGGEYAIDVEEFDVVILSQSCDLTHDGKITNVLVCPYYPFRAYALERYAVEKTRDANKALTGKLLISYYEELRKGQQPNFHLLQGPGDSFQAGDYLVVDFRNVYAVHLAFLRQYLAELPRRPRVLSPYREHLSQAFARFFMRVGLPQDLPRMEPDQAKAYLPE